MGFRITVANSNAISILQENQPSGRSIIASYRNSKNESSVHSLVGVCPSLRTNRLAFLKGVLKDK